MSNRNHALNETPVTDREDSTVPVWDIAVRVFHWSLVLFFFTAYLSGDDDSLLHEYSGYAVLGLVVFRIVWGFVGTRYARFSNFVYPPREVKAYLKSLFTRHPKRYLGHNPAGGVMVLALLSSLVASAWSGILAQEPGDAEFRGMGVVSTALANGDDDDDDDDEHEGSEVWEEIHEFFANLTLLLVFAHVSGVVLSSLLHRENLVRPMITGRKPADDG